MSATPLEWLYTCESYNMKVMLDDMKVLSIYGDHNESMSNNDVMVFTNMFTKTNFLPNGLAEMFPKLERFYVASSRLKHVFRKNFIGFKNLKHLDLRYNDIESIPDDAFIDLFNLEVLTLSGNSIKKLPSNAFVSMMELRYFDASDNEISEFNDEMFSTNSKLEEILLENNQIKNIKSNFSKFKSIGFIDLRDNSCVSSFYLRDHPDYPLISEFQQEVNSNCTKKEEPKYKLAYIKKILQWDICPRINLPMNMLCLFERKFMSEGKP
jgi:Leucine-rich repeat (LRR) protein